MSSASSSGAACAKAPRNLRISDARSRSGFFLHACRYALASFGACLQNKRKSVVSSSLRAPICSRVNSPLNGCRS